MAHGTENATNRRHGAIYTHKESVHTSGGLGNCLRAEEEELGGVLAVVRVRDGVGALEHPVLALESLDEAEEDEGAAELVTVVLAKVHVPVGGGVHELELRGLALGGEGRGGDAGEELLELGDGLLAKGRAHHFDDRGVEGDVDDQVGHDGKFLVSFEF